MIKLSDRGNVVIISLSVFVFLLLINLQIVSFDEDFYFERFEVIDGFNIEEEFSKILYYVNGKDIELEEGFLNNKEIIHLKDVRGLFNLSKLLMWISGLSLVLFGVYYIKRFKVFLRGVKYGCYSLIIFILLLLFLSFISFDAVFLNFHKIAFSNDLWLLNPLEDNLIKILPQEIFEEIVKKLLLYSIVSSLIILCLVRVIKDRI